MAKFEWKDGVDGGTPLSADNLNAMQDGIYEDIIDVYSTEEVKTNKIWTDGKPIYRITTSGTYTSSTSRVQIDLIENVDKLVNDYGNYSPNSTTPNHKFGTPMIGTTGSIDAQSSIRVSNNIIQALFTTISSYEGMTGSYEITLEYTKTTD